MNTYVSMVEFVFNFLLRISTHERLNVLFWSNICECSKRMGTEFQILTILPLI